MPHKMKKAAVKISGLIDEIRELMPNFEVKRSGFQTKIDILPNKPESQV